MDGPDTTQAARASETRVVEMEVELKPQDMDESADATSSEAKNKPSKRGSGERQTAAQPQEELCPDQPLEARIEALLMSSDRALPESRLAEILGIAGGGGGKGASKRVNAAIEALNELYESSSRSFRAERLAGGWQLLTVPAFGPLLHRLHEKRQETRLSQPALETLSIVAYRQPIMRAEIEAIRGVASGEVLRNLLERRLVKIVGRAEELGRPMLYGTTSEFLKVFGMANMDDLPQIKGLNLPNAPRPTIAAETATKTADSVNDVARPSDVSDSVGGAPAGD